jgi:hypothetical protein
MFDAVELIVVDRAGEILQRPGAHRDRIRRGCEQRQQYVFKPPSVQHSARDILA